MDKVCNAISTFHPRLTNIKIAVEVKFDRIKFSNSFYFRYFAVTNVKCDFDNFGKISKEILYAR